MNPGPPQQGHAEEALRRSEEKYRALFTSIDEGFCIQEVLFDELDRAVDLRYLEVNHAFERLTGLHGAAGRTARGMGLDLEASWLGVQADVARTGEAVRFENYVSAWGKWFDIYSFRIGAPSERRVASVFQDITLRRRDEDRLRQAADFDAFRVALNDALRALDDPARIEAVALRVLGERLQVDRAFYAGIESADSGGTLVDELRAGRIVVVPDVEAERRLAPVERDDYLARDARAFVQVPLLEGGRLAAILTVQQGHPRGWTPGDVARVDETAQRTSGAMERARAEAALRRARAELEARVEERTRELEQMNVSLRAEMAERHRAEKARLELLRQLVNAQEAERRRISRDLHDELGQLVSALTLKLSMLRQDPAMPPAMRAQLESLEAIAKETDDVLDFLVRQLRPTALDDLGLVAALDDYVHNWSQRFGVDAHMLGPATEAARLDPEIETVLYRVAQETLNNVAKHARARHVDVKLERGAGHVSLAVSDDGVGFDPETAAREARGLGLLGMRERAGFIGGELVVQSTPGRGTLVKVNVPLAATT